MEKYFMMSMRFDKTSHIDFGLTTTENPQIYLMKSDKSQWIKRDLYDYGWGNEVGFEKIPKLAFKKLITLVELQNKLRKKHFWKGYSINELKEYRENENNRLGAVSVIMQDHIEEFIEFLSKKINTDYFANSNIRDNYKWFAFNSEKTWKTGNIPSGILTQSYEEILNQYPKWHEISAQVINQIYS